MPAVQRTFELVPTTLARPVAHPPMTSKAAKKAYQKSKNPTKITRAEQRKRDAEVLERLRKENEKERAAAKAKIAREKKAAKAKEEREQRKRKGVPEPRKGVRASQPTIALFVRGGNSVGFANGNGKRGWRDVESAGDEDDMDESPEPPTKKVAIQYDRIPAGTQRSSPLRSAKNASTPSKTMAVVIPAKHTNIPEGTTASTKPARHTSSKGNAASSPIGEPSSLRRDLRKDNTTSKCSEKPIKMEKLVEPDLDSEDEFGEFPSLTQTDILDKLDSSFDSMPPSPGPIQTRSMKEPKIHTHKSLPRSPEKDDEFDEDDFGDSMASTQFFMEALLIPPKEDVVLNVERPDNGMASGEYSTPTVSTLDNKRRVSDVDEFDDGMASTQFFTEAMAVVSMIESREATPVIDKAEARRSPKDNSGRAAPGNTVTTIQCITPSIISSARRSVLGERSINMPPPKLPLSHKSTAFASPAFKARLVPQTSRTAPPVDSPFIPKPKFIPIAAPPLRPRFLPKNHKKAVIHALPPSATQAFLENNLEDFFPSPTQEKRELDEIMDGAASLPSNTQIHRDISPSKPAIKALPIIHADFQLPSTQDFMISSQDLCEMNTPKPTPAEPAELPRISKLPSKSQPSSSEKGRFFKEKDDDLKQAGLIVAPKTSSPPQQESASNARATPSQEIRAIEAAIAESKELAEIRQRAGIVYEDAEDDRRALEAALVESKRLADLEAQQKEQEQEKSRRFFREKEDDLVNAALWASKQPDAAKGENPAKKKRTFKKVESCATDYGDDDFMSSQEFLALCNWVDV